MDSTSIQNHGPIFGQAHQHKMQKGQQTNKQTILLRNPTLNLLKVALKKSLNCSLHKNL